ncbi:MAG: flavodoxin [Deltaproteobacteria bacterium]|nr:flavodoxin [Deltaproteobacteria bacterium]
MNKICILYDSVTGSTAEIADLLKNKLSEQSPAIDIIPISPNFDLSEYDTVIIGSPLRFGGFTSRIRKFINKNKDILKDKQIFIYITLLYITRVDKTSAFEIPCYIDPSLGIRTIEKSAASSMDISHSLGYYHNKMDKHLHGIHPYGIGFFNGRLIIKKLPLFERLFMKLVIRLTTKEKEGDFINPEAVREWAASISSQLK